MKTDAGSTGRCVTAIAVVLLLLLVSLVRAAGWLAYSHSHLTKGGEEAAAPALRRAEYH